MGKVRLYNFSGKKLREKIKTQRNGYRENETNYELLHRIETSCKSMSGNSEFVSFEIFLSSLDNLVFA